MGIHEGITMTKTEIMTNMVVLILDLVPSLSGKYAEPFLFFSLSVCSFGTHEEVEISNYADYHAQSDALILWSLNRRGH